MKIREVVRQLEQIVNQAVIQTNLKHLLMLHNYKKLVQVEEKKNINLQDQKKIKSQVLQVHLMDPLIQNRTQDSPKLQITIMVHRIKNLLFQLQDQTLEMVKRQHLLNKKKINIK